MGNRGKQEKETLCWGCQNYSRCSWSRGKPVKGWTATPTIIIDVTPNGKKETHSFLVEACPHFKADNKKRILLKDVAAMLGVHERTLYRLIYKKGRDNLGDLLKEKGYKLHVYKDEKLTQYFIEKL